jgi:mRNA interferase MazF
VVKRGDLHLVKKPGGGDPKRQRVFVVVSHQGLLDTSYSTVICAPVYSNYHGLQTQVLVGNDER